MKKCASLPDYFFAQSEEWSKDKFGPVWCWISSDALCIISQHICRIYRICILKRIFRIFYTFFPGHKYAPGCVEIHIFCIFSIFNIFLFNIFDR